MQIRKFMKWLPLAALLLAVTIYTPRIFGQAATQHSITLGWTLSATPGVTSQIIYRGTSATGPWTAIATLGPTITTYIDTTATPGTQYFYEADALVGTTSSGPSNQVSGTEPANPLAQTGLTLTAQ